MKVRIYVTLLFVLLYFIAKYFVPELYIVFSPIAVIVSFLHETGHALFALLSGGKVSSIQVSSHFGGLAVTLGGVRWLVLIGGYVGSAILGNILLTAGLLGKKWSTVLSYLLSAALIFIAVSWMNDNLSRIVLIASAVVLFVMTLKFKEVVYVILTIIGVLALAYIIEDFRVGPGSDIQKFAVEVPLFNQTIWTYIWLILVVGITSTNVLFTSRYIPKNRKNKRKNKI